MAKMAADCGSPTNMRPFGPKASGPADFKSAVPCFMAVVSAAGRLPAVNASPNKAARRRQVIERMESLLGRKRGEIIPRAAIYHRKLCSGCKDHLRLPWRTARPLSCPGAKTARTAGVSPWVKATHGLTPVVLESERAADARRTSAVFHRIGHPRDDAARQSARGGQPGSGDARF